MNGNTNLKVSCVITANVLIGESGWKRNQKICATLESVNVALLR